MQRRRFLAFAAAAPALQGAPATTLGKMSLGKIPTRKAGKVEIVFKSPGPQPNPRMARHD